MGPGQFPAASAPLRSGAGGCRNRQRPSSDAFGKPLLRLIQFALADKHSHQGGPGIRGDSTGAPPVIGQAAQHPARRARSPAAGTPGPLEPEAGGLRRRQSRGQGLEHPSLDLPGLGGSRNVRSWSSNPRKAAIDWTGSEGRAAVSTRNPPAGSPQRTRSSASSLERPGRIPRPARATDRNGTTPVPAQSGHRGGPITRQPPLTAQVPPSRRNGAGFQRIRLRLPGESHPGRIAPRKRINTRKDMASAMTSVKCKG